MTKEYLKMADVFDEQVDAVERHYGITNAIVELSSATLGDFVTLAHAQYAAHAINSHDELVAENERLREHNKNMREVIDRMSKAIWGKQEEIDRFRDTIGMTQELFIEQYCCFPHPEQK